VPALEALLNRKLNPLHGVYTDVGKVSVYGFHFRRGGDMKTRKLWAWAVLLASFAFMFQLSTIARAQDDDDQDQAQAQDPPSRV
jgi:hypothetical protein